MWSHQFRLFFGTPVDGSMSSTSCALESGFRAPYVGAPSWDNMESAFTWAVTDTQVLPPGFMEIAKKRDAGRWNEQGRPALLANWGTENRELSTELVRIIPTMAIFQSLV